ncbi:hypothetical protein DSECCO2_235950 [anaerobic digester metagenome]
MNGPRIIVLLLLLLLLLPGAQAVRMIGGDDPVVVSEPIDDDVFAAGGMLSIEAPVDSLIAAGGEIEVSAPVRGDVIVAGGKVLIDTSVGGKVVIAGGEVTLDGPVARNAVVTGGEVVFGPNTSIGRDAHVMGGSFRNEGRINGTLQVSSESFVNQGSANVTRYDEVRDRSDGPDPVDGFLSGIGALISFMVILGYLVLGLILLALCPSTATLLESRVRDQPLPALVVGVASIIAAIILGMLLLVTIVGIPIAVLLWLGVVAGIMVAGLIVALSVGRIIARVVKIGENRFVLFVVGFIVLNILYLVPLLGGLAKLLVVCIGFGVIVMTVLDRVSTSRRTS